MVGVDPPDIRHSTIYSVTLATSAQEFSKLKIRVLKAYPGREISSWFTDGFFDQVESNCEVFTRCHLIKIETGEWMLQLKEVKNRVLSYFVPNMTLVRCIERCDDLPQHIKEEVVASWIEEVL
jgi:hypothetical protein